LRLIFICADFNQFVGTMFADVGITYNRLKFAV